MSYISCLYIKVPCGKDVKLTEKSTSVTKMGIYTQAIIKHFKMYHISRNDDEYMDKNSTLLYIKLPCVKQKAVKY